MLRSRIDEAIRTRASLAVHFTSLSDSVERCHKYIVEQILIHMDREDLVDLTYASVKELAVNAVKANMKRLVYEEAGLSPNSIAEHREALDVFKRHLTEAGMRRYGEQARAKGLYVRSKFNFDNDRLVVLVCNNLEYKSYEEELIRQKFRLAEGYDDIVQFYMDNPEADEGAGLGITMVTTMLKNSDMDPHLFTIFARRPETRAKLEIPLTRDYVPARHKYRAQAS